MVAKKIYRLQKRVGSKARILKPYKIKKTGFEDIGLYLRFPWHQTFVDPFVGGWSVALNHPCFNQEIWNTRTIPVIAVNDINSGIIDLAWVLLYIPWNFKMSVKSAIHCQGLWNECRDKALLDRFRSSLRFYYSLEANFHKKEFKEGLSVEEGIRHSYQSELSWGGRDGKGLWIRHNMNRLPYQQLRGVPMEEIENGLRHYYKHAGSRNDYDRDFGFYRNKTQNINRLKSLHPLHEMNERAHEEALREWYQQVHSYSRMGTAFNYDIDNNRGALRVGEPLGHDVEDALRSWYLSQHSYGSRKAFRFSQNEQRNMNVGSERGEIDPSFEEGFQNWYRSETSHSASRGRSLKILKNKRKRIGPSGRRIIISEKKDYYDEIHSRLRWMQIFNEGYKGGIYNEDFAKFLRRFIGKMDCGFIYGDPTYFKTLTGKHYEDVLTLEQHKELSDLLHEADKTNTTFLLSYDVDERVEKLYSSFDFETIQVPYSVARSYGDGRAQSDEEYLIRNYNYKEDPYMKKVDFTKKTKLDTFFS